MEYSDKDSPSNSESSRSQNSGGQDGPKNLIHFPETITITADQAENLAPLIFVAADRITSTTLSTKSTKSRFSSKMRHYLCCGENQHLLSISPDEAMKSIKDSFDNPELILVTHAKTGLLNILKKSIAATSIEDILYRLECEIKYAFHNGVEPYINLLGIELTRVKYSFKIKAESDDKKLYIIEVKANNKTTGWVKIPKPIAKNATHSNFDPTLVRNQIEIRLLSYLQKLKISSVDNPSKYLWCTTSSTDDCYLELQHLECATKTSMWSKHIIGCPLEDSQSLAASGDNARKALMVAQILMHVMGNMDANVENIIYDDTQHAVKAMDFGECFAYMHPDYKARDGIKITWHEDIKLLVANSHKVALYKIINILTRDASCTDITAYSPLKEHKITLTADEVELMLKTYLKVAKSISSYLNDKLQPIDPTDKALLSRCECILRFISNHYEARKQLDAARKQLAEEKKALAQAAAAIAKMGIHTSHSVGGKEYASENQESHKEAKVL